MRILAVRGANLASLAAPFEVDFEQPPLADVGLFAITGPTGSGKSTILDALCLALFDQVPRLPGGRGVPIGRESDDAALRIASNDVRSVLRRGAGEGFAEVDFVGDDGKRYRARWDVRRARRKADGKMQFQHLGLTCLDTNEAVGHTKTEVLAGISSRLGLTFDQFRRSVLLAQGDFAAFLKASSDERAGLLERITGTELYSGISKAAFRRAAEEQSRLTQLKARLADFEPLDPEARAALEAEHQALAETIRRIDGERDSIRKIVEWHDRDRALKASEAEARQALDTTQSAWDGAAGRREMLKELEHAQPLRPRLEAFRAAVAAVAEVEARLAEAKAVQGTANRAAEAAEAEHRAAADQLTRARQEREDNKGRLNKARQLDVRIETAARQAEEAAAKAADASGRAKAMNDRVAVHEQSHEATARELDQASAWLQEHRQYETLAREWGRWEEKLQRYARRKQEADQVDAERVESGQLLEAARSRLAGAQGAQQAAQEAIRNHAADLEVLESRAKALPADALRRERRQLDAERDRVREAQRLTGEATDLAGRIEARERQLDTARASGTASAATLADIAAQLPLQEAKLEEVDRALALALASRDEQVEHLRILLEPGLPCPVCGGLEHPWAGQELVFDAGIQAHRDRQAQLKAAQDELRKRQATAEAEGRQAAEAIRRITPELDDDRTRQQALARAWDDVTLADKPAFALAALPLLEALAERLDAVKERRVALDGKEQQADRLAREISGTRRAVDQARDAMQAATTQVHDAESTSNELEGRLRDAGLRADRVAEELGAIVDMLARPLGVIADWRDALGRDAAALIERCAAWERLWSENTRRRDRCREILTELDKTLTGARTAAQAAQSVADEAERTKAALNEALGGLRGKRAGFFEGKSADSVEHVLDVAAEAAEALEKTAGQELSDVQWKASAAAQAVVATAAEAERRQTEWSGAQRRLDEALAAAGLPLPLLEQRLVHDAQWIADENQAVEGLREARENAVTVLAERARQRQAHEAMVPECSRDDAIARVELLGTQLDERRHQFAERVARLRQDDDKRAKAAALAGETGDQASRVRTWSSINDLIGSADGKKFRVFAQSLTLQALLAHANEHLEDLSRRYRLQRVPGSDLELQVIDADMGDEVRSVHSLSGGESFLVSLALALGLASLSSQTARVESLFIDEGFGSLDQDALDMAIASLDTLQSLGRKIGVISHVPTLVERIGTRIRIAPQGGGRSVVEVRQG